MDLDVHGVCEEGFGRFADAFRANFDSGLELGASLSVTHAGRKVVDLWAGPMWPDTTRPWGEDTIVPVASSGKIPAAMSLFLLIDRGRAELDAPVARYWPEFAQGGKAAVTVREALSHRAGVPGLDAGISMADFIQWDTITARLAAEPHWFAGKPRLTYHAMMYVPLIGRDRPSHRWAACTGCLLLPRRSPDPSARTYTWVLPIAPTRPVSRGRRSPLPARRPIRPRCSAGYVGPLRRPPPRIADHLGDPVRPE